MPELIRPKDLAAGTPAANAALIFDNGTQVLRANPLDFLNAATPLASQAEAEAGTDNAKRVTPLRVSQAVTAKIPAIGQSLLVQSLTNPATPGGLISGSDTISMSNQFITTNLTGTRTKAQIAHTIIVNDGQTGPQSSPTNPTPASASYGLSIVNIRPGWSNSGITGEINGQSTFLRQGNSDVAGALYNIGVRNGFAAVHEALTFGSDDNGNLVKAVRIQTGVINNRDGGEFGFLTNAEKGTNLNTGVMVQSTPGSGASWQNLYKGLNPDGVRVFSVTGITGAIHSGDPSGWLESYRPNALGLAQIAGVSVGMNGVLGASRSSGNTIVGNMGCIGGQFFAINDNTAQVQSAYAAYIEATKMPGAGTTHAIEFDMVNRGSLVQIDPHIRNVPSGITPGIWAASGGEFAANAATAAFVTVNNGAKWDKGIVFLANSLVTRGDNKQEAISFGLRDAMTFYGANRNVLGNIYGDGSGDGIGQVGVCFKGAQLLIARANGSGLMQYGQNSTETQTLVPFGANSANVGDAALPFATGYMSRVRLFGTTFSALTASFPAASNEGMIARITDAATPITTFNQVVTAGGGTNKATVISNGTNYVAISS